MPKLTDLELHQAVVSLVTRERTLTAEIIGRLREVESRRVYAKLGYASLFEYCREELKYCNASAQLRIDAMRLSREVPQVGEALDRGTVSLSSVGKLQKFFRAEVKVNARSYSASEKSALFARIENKSEIETEKMLSAVSPSAFAGGKESIRVVTPKLNEVMFFVPDEVVEMIEEARMKLRRRGVADPNLADVFTAALKKYLGKTEPRSNPPNIPNIKEAAVTVRAGGNRSAKAAEAAKAEVVEGTQASAASSTSSGEAEDSMTVQVPAAAERLSYYSVSLRRALFEKTGGRCVYHSPLTGRRCSATLALETEHAQPLGKGGTNELENLTLLCPAHNRLRAIEVYGERHMAKFLNH